MAIKHSITLSTTEPNNEVGVIKIRQADEQTQTLEVQITENGVPKSYQGLAVYFCAKLGQTAGLGIIEQKLKPEEMANPANGKLEYTMRAEDWQILGRQKGYFSFRKMKDEHEFIDQFTTRDFTFDVIKSVYSDGLKEVKKDGGTYIWTIEDMVRLFKEYIATGKTDWEEFVEQNREILESVDPGGELLSEVIVARGESYQTIGERLDSDKAEVSTQLAQSMSGKINANQFIDIKTALENSVGKTLEIPAGVYTLDDKVEIVGDMNIICLGDVVIDARNNPHDIAISLGGEKTNNTFSLTTNANKGSKRINLTDTTGLKLGDILHIVSRNLWNPTREYYRKGELVKIEGVTSNSVDIALPLYDSYTTEEILVIEQIEPRNIFLDNLTLIRDGINTGIEINYANVKLNSVSVNKANNKGIALNYCYGGYVNDGTTDCDYYETSGLSYGLSINSSYNINVNGGFYKAGRHGVQHGGWIPCRNIKHSGVTVDNAEVSNVGAFDAHGNVEFLYINNLTSMNGIAIGASNFDFSDSMIKSRSTYEAIRINVGRSCDSMRIKGITIDSIDTKNMIRVDSPMANQFTVKDISIKDIVVITPDKTTVSIPATGSLFFADINVNKCSIDNIYYKSNHTDSKIDYTLELKDSFIYDTLEISNVIIHSSESVMYLSIPDNSVAHLRNIDFKSNILDNLLINIQGLGNLTIDNIILDGDNATARANIRPNGYVHVNNMTLKNFKGESVRFDNTLDLQVDNVKLSGSQQPTYLSTIPYVSKSGYGQRIFMYPHVPTIGSFVRGDRIINSNPSVGQPKGWLCTMAGSPGTWVSEGNL